MIWLSFCNIEWIRANLVKAVLDKYE